MKKIMKVGLIVILFLFLIAAAIYIILPREENTTLLDDDTSHGNIVDNATVKQGYDGFIEFDPDNNLTVTDNRITFTQMHRNYIGIVYKNFGLGYFGREFTHTFQFNVTSGNTTVEGTFMPWSVCNEIGTVGDFLYPQNCSENLSANFTGLTLTIQPRLKPDVNHIDRTGPRGFLSDWSIKTRVEFFLPAEDFYGKMIYTVVIRNNSHLGVFFYRDEAHHDIITSEVIKTGSESYSTLQALASRGSQECDPFWNPTAYVSGYIENLNLEKKL